MNRLSILIAFAATVLTALPGLGHAREDHENLFQVARSGTADQVAAMIQQGALVDIRDAYGQTPLMYAAGQNPDIRVITALIDAGADINAVTHAGWTALFYAARDTRNPDTIRALLHHHADATLTNQAGRVALDYASMNPYLGDSDALAELAIKTGPLRLHDRSAHTTRMDSELLRRDEADAIQRLYGPLTETRDECSEDVDHFVWAGSRAEGAFTRPGATERIVLLHIEPCQAWEYLTLWPEHWFSLNVMLLFDAYGLVNHFEIDGRLLPKARIVEVRDVTLNGVLEVLLAVGVDETVTYRLMETTANLVTLQGGGLDVLFEPGSTTFRTTCLLMSPDDEEFGHLAVTTWTYFEYQAIVDATPAFAAHQQVEACPQIERRATVEASTQPEVSEQRAELTTRSAQRVAPPVQNGVEASRQRAVRFIEMQNEIAADWDPRVWTFYEELLCDNLPADCSQGPNACKPRNDQCMVVTRTYVDTGVLALTTVNVYFDSALRVFDDAGVDGYYDAVVILEEDQSHKYRCVATFRNYDGSRHVDWYIDRDNTIQLYALPGHQFGPHRGHEAARPGALGLGALCD